MKRIFIFALLAFSSVIHGADLAPELAPLAAKHKADDEAINAKRAASVAQVGRNYTMALNTAERTATAAGNVGAIAAITAERDGLKAGNLDSKQPDNLPRDLPTPRKSYLAEVAKVDADIKAQRQRATAAYLQALATLQSRSAANPALLGQIDAEKKALVEGDPATMSAKLAETKWRVGTGDKVLTLHRGGTSSISWAGRKGSWKVTGPNEISWDIWNTPTKEKVFINNEATQIKYPDGTMMVRINP